MKVSDLFSINNMFYISDFELVHSSNRYNFDYVPVDYEIRHNEKKVVLYSDFEKKLNDYEV